MKTECRVTAWQQRKASAEAKVLSQVRESGGFSVFWATETTERAAAIHRLQGRGDIQHLSGKSYGQFPWCGYRMRKEQGL